MCNGCTQTAIENIIDVMLKGYELDVATRLYRDAVIQRQLMDTPEDEKPAEEMLYDARMLSRIVSDASYAISHARETRPDVYEALMQTRTLLAMVKGYV